MCTQTFSYFPYEVKAMYTKFDLVCPNIVSNGSQNSLVFRLMCLNIFHPPGVAGGRKEVQISNRQSLLRARGSVTEIDVQSYTNTNTRADEGGILTEWSRTVRPGLRWIYGVHVAWFRAALVPGNNAFQSAPTPPHAPATPPPLLSTHA